MNPASQSLSVFSRSALVCLFLTEHCARDASELTLESKAFQQTRQDRP